MNCSTVRILTPYLLRPHEMAEDDRALIDAHLAQCAQCRNWVERERQFDRAVARAMKNVDVPADLPVTLFRSLATRRSHRLRMRLTQGAVAVAAAGVIFMLVLSLWNARSVADPVQWAQGEDEQLVLTFNGSRDSVVEFFARRGVKTLVPFDFDYGLLNRMEVVTVEGQPVACLSFQKGANRAKVYVLPRRRFRPPSDPSGMWATGSHCTVEVVEVSRDYLLVIVYFGEANRQLFAAAGTIG